MQRIPRWLVAVFGVICVAVVAGALSTVGGGTAGAVGQAPPPPVGAKFTNKTRSATASVTIFRDKCKTVEWHVFLTDTAPTAVKGIGTPADMNMHVGRSMHNSCTDEYRYEWANKSVRPTNLTFGNGLSTAKVNTTVTLKSYSYGGPVPPTEPAETTPPADDYWYPEPVLESSREVPVNLTLTAGGPINSWAWRWTCCSYVDGLSSDPTTVVSFRSRDVNRNRNATVAGTLGRVTLPSATASTDAPAVSAFTTFPQFFVSGSLSVHRHACVDLVGGGSPKPPKGYWGSGCDYLDAPIAPPPTSTTLAVE